MKLSALLLGVTAAPVAALGSVKDDHGCIPSAGYSWCESSQKCVRPWEEGCEAADEDDTAPVLGGDVDNNSCIASAGYNFCSELKTCVRYWEANADGVSYADLCPSMMKSLLAAADDGALRGRRRLSGVALGGVKDEHGCIPSAGYSWCESSQKCIRPWEEGCEDNAAGATDADNTDTAVLGADTDGTGCLASAGYAFCPELKTCVRYWEADGNGVSYADLCPTMMKAMQAEATDSDSNSNSSATAARRVLQLGGTKDENGCYVSAGYQWCETTSKCFRPWEEACAGVDVIADTTTAAVEVEDPPVVGGNKDENGCCTSCGYSWCDEMSVCVQPWLVDLAKQCPTLLKQLQAETYVNSR